MLSTLLVKLSLLLTLLFIICLGLIRAQHYDDEPVRSLLFHDDCAAICWQGIRPGVTTRAQALQILEDSAWVDEIHISDNVVGADIDVIQWTWSGQQPEYFDAHIEGGVISDNGLIQVMRLNTNIPFGDVWIALGQPISGFTERDSVTSLGVQQAYYQAMRVHITSVALCPYTSRTFWSAPVTIDLTTLFESGEIDDYVLPGWLKNSICKS